MLVSAVTDVHESMCLYPGLFLELHSPTEGASARSGDSPMLVAYFTRSGTRG